VSGNSARKLDADERVSTESILKKIEPVAKSTRRMDMNYLVRALVKYNASDLHIKAGRPPLFRINGKLVAAKMPPFDVALVEEILKGILTPKQFAEFEEKKQIDLSFRIQDFGRFRCNVFQQRGSMSAAIRMIPFTVPKLDDLGVPAVLKELVQRPRGLILVTGATGSGKSTTLAAMVHHLNENENVHILTIEDPIEFVHRDMKASISQREVGSDALSLEDALHAGLRQDPDVIVIGELRDAKTIHAALTAAETGHLVIATLHTNDAKSTIDRVIDSFPADSQNQVRIQLANCLVAIISQQLLVRTDRSSRVPACEILVKSPAIEEHILRNEVNRIQEAIAGSNSYYKMQTMNQALEQLVLSGTITVDDALKVSPSPDDLKLRLSGVQRGQGFDLAQMAQKVSR